MTSDEMQNSDVEVVEVAGNESLIDPETGWSRLAARQIVKSIRIASDISSWVWTTTTYKELPILNIGNTNFVSGGKDGATFLLVDRDALEAEAMEMFETFRTTGDLMSNPSFSWVDLPLQSTARGLEVFADAHKAAISKEAPKWKINQRWKWYQDEARQRISEVAGKHISEPGYIEQLRALKATESLPPITSMYSQPLIEQMATSIMSAHDLGSSCWSLFPTNKQIALNVGQETVGGSAVAGKYDFVVDMEKLDPEQREWSSSLVKPKPTNQYPTLLFLQLPNDVDATQLAILQEAHRSALAELTKVFKKATLWNDHQENFREQLEQASGMLLPHPAYEHENSDVLSLQHVAGRRYWRFGRYALNEIWSLMAQQSIVGIENWSESKIDLNELPNEHDAFIQAIRQFKTIGAGAAEHTWRIRHGIQTGDLVFGMSGSNVRGWGTVTGDYEYVEGAKPLEHQRPVEWQSTALNRPLPQTMRERLRQEFDPGELSLREFATAIGATLSGASAGSIELLPHVRGHFESTGLHYTDSQIATFYTALQTKGFVVLSGISGTGKSKIAQHFVELLPEPPETPVDPVDSGVLQLKRMPSFSLYHRVTLPTRQIDALSFPDTNESWTIRARMEGKQAEAVMMVQWQGGQRSVQLYIKGEVRALIARVEENGRLYGLPGFDEENGRISSIEFFRNLPRQLPVAGQAQPRTGSNHLFLSVRPDWRDSTSLLGYFNPLTSQYQWTDFLRFILRAAESYKAKDGLAWFVILDEMNLAHVEYYFADLLSVIESGRNDDGFSKEPLRTSFAKSGDDDGVPPREIFLPPSLYIIGTVNMDETTHAFSPKVLDRAFTIELTEVDFREYPPQSMNGASPLDEAGRRAMLTAFTRNGAFARIDKSEIAAAVARDPEIRDHLQSLNELLKRHRFHFGYRIFDEIAQYLFNNDLNEMMSFSEAFDAAVFMKVLPKFTGSRSRLRSPLLSLLAWAIDPVAPDPDGVTKRFEASLSSPDTAPKVLVDGPTYPTVARRALQMLETLETDGFVSFG